MAKKKNRRAKEPRERAAVPSAPAAVSWWPDGLNLAILAAFAFYLGHASWMRSPDPLIDFGRELYLPWRLAQGAVLYQDALHLYGPFSPYLNSVIFRLAGAGLSTLVTANAVIYSVILGLLYFLVRAGWGRWAALTSSAFFVGVFSFAHLVRIANYNFLTPYSHELTHGILLLLGLAYLLWKTVCTLDARWAAGAGLLAGVSLLMKPEIIFAAAGATAGAASLIVLRDFRRRPWGRWIRSAVCFLTGAAVPMTLGALLFWWRAGFSLREAFYRVNFAWLVVFQYLGLETGDPFQNTALGMDQAWRNLASEVVWGGAAVILATGLAWSVRTFSRAAPVQKMLCGVLVLAAAVATMWVPWMGVGYALPGFLVCGLLLEIALWRTAENGSPADAATLRILLWFPAAAMLARMALYPRISHYGFAQAALAGVVSVAILVSTIPGFFRLNAGQRRGYQALVTLLVVFILGGVASSSVRLFAYHDFQVGEGADRFYALGPRFHPSALLVEEARKYLVKDAKENNVRSLLVLPEGVILY
jgi:hypothetical protein